MASRRMVPTHFFKDPDIMNLGSKETQLILIGLILTADDEGRAVAHAGLLGREIDYPAEQMIQASAPAAASSQQDDENAYRAYFLQRLSEVKERGYQQEVAS